MFNSKKLVLGLVAAFALAIGLNAAIAGEEAPAKAKPAVTKEAPAKAETATPSPIHTMMKWVAKEVTGGDCKDNCCASTEKGAVAWRAWFAKTDGNLSGLRTAMIADGWNADRTIGFFKEMASKKSCSEGCKCEGCEKGAAGPAADKAKTGDCEKGCCGGCSKEKGAAGPAADKAKTGDCEKGCCGGCSKEKGAAGPAADKAKTGDCEKGCCGGCSKEKGAAGPAADKAKTGDCEKGCCGGCKKEKGAAGPAADAEKAKTDDAPSCPGCPGK